MQVRRLIHLLRFSYSDLLQARMSALHQIYRAVLTSPDPLPNTILSVNIQDGPSDFTLSYSRPAYDPRSPGTPFVSRAFLMPHFSFWAWPLPFVGSFVRAEGAINSLEATLPFSKKDPRVVWRGTKRYKSAHNPHLRVDLLRVTGGVEWADVQTLEWDAVNNGTGTTKKVATNSLMIEDFCKYKYVLYTDGVTYSGRLQFHQMCGSVLLTPPIAWMQHTTHLVKPLFSSDLDFGDANRTWLNGTEKRWVPSEGEQEAWPIHYKPDEANIVFVAPDWSDLEDTVRWLESRPDEAEGIARRQRELFVDGGYFSRAAEACYWRALIRGWSTVCQTDGEGWEDQLGTRWELFSIGL